MLLNIRIEDQTYPLDVPDSIVAEGSDFFSVIDRDLDKGWQMSRSWVDNPDNEQRCQIVADKMLSAFEHENQKSLLMLAGYILARMPEVKSVDISTSGEIQETSFEF